jgi:hypothetical protein
MKNIITSTVLCILSLTSYGQSDTIYANNEKILCSVKEVTNDAVRYAYAGEDLTNSIYKNAVQKIAFKNGRVQTFAESTSFKTVHTISDYENVAISKAENEILGLYKVGDVSSKARAATNFTNQEKIKERAYRKLRIQAAMQGANVIYLTNQKSEGMKLGGRHQTGTTAETTLTGIGYTNQIPNFDEFRKAISDKRNFTAIRQSELYSNATDLSEIPIQKQFKIDKITNENGLIMLQGNLEGVSKQSVFRVVTFSDSMFNIFYEDKSSAYNIMIRL